MNRKQAPFSDTPTGGHTSIIGAMLVFWIGFARACLLKILSAGSNAPRLGASPRAAEVAA